MRAILIPTLLLLGLTACMGGSSDLQARVEALEAKAHSQAKKIDDLTKKVEALSKSAGSDQSPEPTP